MARLRAAGGPRGLAPRPLGGAGVPEQEHHPRPRPLPRLRLRSRPPREGRPGAGRPGPAEVLLGSAGLEARGSRRLAPGRPPPRFARSRPARVQRDAPAHLRAPRGRARPGRRSPLDDAHRGPPHRGRARRGRRDGRPPLAGEPPGAVRTAAARDAGPHRVARQRHAVPPGLRPARRDFGPRDFQRQGHDRGRRAADLRGLAHAALRGAALLARAQAAPPRDPVGQPQVPEPRLHPARPAGARGPL